MRLALLPFFLVPLWAQEAAPAPKLQAPAAAPEGGQAPKPQPPTAAPEAPPAAAAESAVSGSIEIGNRWNTGVAGNFNAYRSVVNLGEGPKLLGAEITILDPKKRLFDRLEARGYNWGDDPYSSFQLNARKARLYRLDANYRNIAYFNDLASFANPQLDRGLLLSQRSFDVRRRLVNVQLDLLPGNWMVPYFAVERSAGEGRGVTTFVAEGNEYPVPNLLRDGAANYRGGLRFEFRRAHVTLEQGGTTFRDDQQVFANAGTRNTGNRTTPLLGQNLFLTSLQESYGIRGSGVYSKGMLTASPFSWMDLQGQFLYSVPTNDTRFQQASAGNLWGGQNLFFSAQQFLLSAQAKLPHSSGGFGAEVRPARRLRIVTSWLTDRLHVSSSAQARQSVVPSAPVPPAPAPQNALLATNYSQEQVDTIFDISKRITVRGGYRYVWGDARTAFLPPAGLANSDAAKLARHVGIAGIILRPARKITFNGEAEIASSDHTYFRTSLRNYQKGRVRLRYQAFTSMSVSADLSVLNNQNPLDGIRYDYLYRQGSVSLLWAPNAGKRFSLQGDYSRFTLRSDLEYIAPPFFQKERSFYRDNTHLSSVVADVALPGVRGPKLSFGGSLVVTSGSRPTGYFQPLAKVSAPLKRHVLWVSQWRYYGFGESLYRYEGFRTHLITTGLLITR